MKHKICLEYRLYSIGMQKQSKLEVYTELLSTFYDLVSQKCIPIFLKCKVTFKSFTWSAGTIFYTLLVSK